MMAALALPAPEDAVSAKTSSDLGDDVVTLSYDRALRAHARYQPAERRDWRPELAARVDESLTPQASRAPQDIFDRDLRTASVTVRLSKSECTSLHQRAAEAGVTVSAYLRSCTMEAEALRTQVKEALAELRSTALKDAPAAPPNNQRRFLGWISFGWLAWFLRRGHSVSCG